MSVLQPFSFSCQVQARDAKHDKLLLRVKHAILNGSEEALDSFRNYLAAPPRNLRAIDTGETWGKIFKRPPVSLWMPLKIRNSTKGVASLLPLPLFSGQYSFKRAPGSQRWITDLDLLLNQTRFLRNQNPETFIPPRGPPRGTFSSSDATFFERGDVRTGGEESLDSNDNWIPDTPEFERLHDPRLGPRSLRTYLNGILESIDAELQRVANSRRVAITYRPRIDLSRFDLKSAETYFEFSSGGLTRVWLVASLESLLRSYGDLPLTVHHYPLPPIWDGIGMSRMLTLTVRTGVELKIYAKTNRRVRVEVVHNFAGEKRCRKKHTFATIDGIARLLDELREDATKTVNDVFRHFRNSAALPATDKTAIDLLRDFTTTVQVRNTARILLDALLDKGSIASLTQYRVALARLRKAGILQTRDTNHRKEHVVTMQYRHALKMLREHAAFPHLTTRRRTRTRPPGGE
jgi:hypothetical protein